MLGGLKKSDPAANDEGVELARKAVADKLADKNGRPVKVEVLEAHSQVVAGMKYHLKLKVGDSHIDTKYYEAQVWAKLPAYGGTFEVTDMKEITPVAAGVTNTVEGADDPAVDAAAAYAVQQISQQSNSLFPYQLKTVMKASTSPGSNGDKEGRTHHLALRLAHGTSTDVVFEVDVVEAPHGFVLKSSKQIMV